ncbi:MAG: SPOR domain-containing protein [Burkholderiaceae bacterium]|jgi:DedD protein
MAFFKFRFPGAKTGAEAKAQPPLESVEGMRRRARHRLIGAAVLVLVAVVGFPLVFDTQPRPVAVDVPILIPDKTKVKPLALPSTGAETKAGAPAPVVAASEAARKEAPPPAPAASKPPQVAAQASLDAKEEIVTGNADSKPPKAPVKPASSAVTGEVKREPAPAPKAETKAEPKAEAKAPAAKPADDGNRARALLDGKDAAKPTAADAGRFIVQVGAFADADKAREARLKVERAGVTTYTQVVETPEGKRTRVRVGPFSSKAEAEKAAAKIRGLDLPAAILTL